MWLRSCGVLTANRYAIRRSTHNASSTTKALLSKNEVAFYLTFTSLCGPSPECDQIMSDPLGVLTPKPSVQPPSEALRRRLASSRTQSLIVNPTTEPDGGGEAPLPPPPDYAPPTPPLISTTAAGAPPSVSSVALSLAASNGGRKVTSQLVPTAPPPGSTTALPPAPRSFAAAAAAVEQQLLHKSQNGGGDSNGGPTVPARPSLGYRPRSRYPSDPHPGKNNLFFFVAQSRDEIEGSHKFNDL